MTKDTTKRANGLGSVFQLANGKWRASVTMPDGRAKTRTVATQNQARSALKELTRERDHIDASGVIAPASLTVADVLDSWLTVDLPTRRRAPATVFTYRASAENLKREVGAIKMAKLRVRDLDDAFARLAERGQARASLTKMRSVLAQAFDFGIKRQEVERNLARSITIPASARGPKPTKSLTVEQARRFVEEVSGHRWGALFLIAITCGLRPGELTALCWDSVDIDEGTITVNRGTRRTESGQPLLSDEVKTHRSRRTLRLTPLALTALREHKARQIADDLATGVRSDLVFRTSVGTIVEPRNLARELSRITDRLGLGTDWTPNELRHTAASLLVDQGVPLVTVADVLGHTTTRMLELTYRKNLRPEIDGGVAAMTKLFGTSATA